MIANAEIGYNLVISELYGTNCKSDKYKYIKNILKKDLLDSGIDCKNKNCGCNETSEFIPIIKLCS